MRGHTFSTFSRMMLLACIIFDLAAIVSFFAIFQWFIVLDPLKSIMMLLVLLSGLMLVNVALVFPGALLRKAGVAYSTAIIFLTLLYAVVSNTLSVIFVFGSGIWYVVWELLALAVFLCLFAVIGFFSKSASEDMTGEALEQTAKGLLQVRLMEIEEILITKRHEEGMQPVIDSFARLKERIQASTPFMRITNNRAVNDAENKISEKLEYLLASLEASKINPHSFDAQGLIEETRRLVVQREQLIIT
ncbi:hypothetical protein ACFPVX_22660 [Cohnella faecalis]|uniref:Uncharacterized protein n=1 Tax=Cohnella faecalis TaxID=2315694 RepID=A0A398CIA5_9BACL|nr:hypothetical protein [Cohnella faecalis]RIE02473.1 hypothetical protein D3H35_17390 [Cohnella faecalis]